MGNIIPNIPEETWMKYPPDVRELIAKTPKAIASVNLKHNGNSNNKYNGKQSVHRTILKDDTNGILFNDFDEVQETSNHINNTRLTQNNDDTTTLVSYMSRQDNVTYDNVQQVLNTITGIKKKFNHPMSKASNSSTITKINDANTININGKVYRAVNMITYLIKNVNHDHTGYSLIDCGANGGVLGNDIRILNKTLRTISLTGLNNHQVTDLELIALTPK
jgi:mRNA-degrading endonuclease HigB of HigAB toxin-antitoxin module